MCPQSNSITYILQIQIKSRTFDVIATVAIEKHGLRDVNCMPLTFFSSSVLFKVHALGGMDYVLDISGDDVPFSMSLGG
jgi:hypothetical protein